MAQIGAGELRLRGAGTDEIVAGEPRVVEIGRAALPVVESRIALGQTGEGN